MLNAPAAPADGQCDGVGLLWLVKSVVGGAVKQAFAKSWTCADAYNAEHPNFTLAIVCALYIGLQTFAIPGPIVLSVLAGALYGFWGGQLLIAVCAGTGASFCFLLSRTLGRGVLHAYKLDGRIEGYKAEVLKHRDGLFTYMLLTRVTPVPNVLVNVASALVGVPLWIFAVTTPIGQFPLNALHTTTGVALSQLATDGGKKMEETLEQNKATATWIALAGMLLCGTFYWHQRRQKIAAAEK
eukprot:g4431.t1